MKTAWGEEALNRNCAEKRTVEETYARGWRSEIALG
jgi:hypothetical protein